MTLCQASFTLERKITPSVLKETQFWMYFFVSISKVWPNIVLLTPNKHIIEIYLVANLMIFILYHNYLYFYIHNWISLLYCTKIRDSGRIIFVVFLPHVTSNGPGVQLSRAEAACMPVPKSWQSGHWAGCVRHGPQPQHYTPATPNS